MPAAAHLTPNSEVRLDFGRSTVAADIMIPLGELSYAIGRPLSPQPRELTGAEREQLSRYLLGHIHARAADGRGWRIEVEKLAVASDGFAPDLDARLLMTPPEGASTRVFDLDYGAVIDKVANHFVLVLIKTDFDRGTLSDKPQILGGLQGSGATLRVDRGPGSAWRGFASAIGLGMHHIAEGHDHLLFLFALLLPAPLIARGGRWREYGGVRHTLRRLVAVVTAFTIGHSITLIGGAFFGWALPSRPVEVLIAISILVSAIHACRPLFPGREAWVAGGFGLVHGLAFATLIGRFGLEPLQKAQSILGFNLGIELVQLGVVLAILPALLIFARTPAYTYARLGGAWLAIVAATAWAVERAFGIDNPVGRAIDAGLGFAPWLLAAALLGAIGALLLKRRTVPS